MIGRHTANWSLTIGRPWGVPLRLHFFFFVFVILTLTFTWPDMIEPGLITLGVLFASLLLHELAHATAALRMGGEVDEIVIGPFGGLIAPRVPDEPEVQVFVALAGPLVHLVLVVAAAAALSLGSDTNVIELLKPVVSVNLMGIENGNYWVLTGKLIFWLNWMLLLVNLLPAYPFDGGPALRATLWPVIGRRRAGLVTSRMAMVVAFCLCIGAFFLRGAEPHPTIPLGVPLVTLAIFLYFSAKQDLAATQQAAALLNDTPGYHPNLHSLELLDELFAAKEDEQDAVLVQKRYDQRIQHRAEARQAEEEYEDAQVDDILARLHEASIEDLTNEERALLNRASERYRRRNEPRDDS